MIKLRKGRASDLRSRGRELGFQLTSARLRTTTLGKLFTPMYLDADILRYYYRVVQPGTSTCKVVDVTSA